MWLRRREEAVASFAGAAAIDSGAFEAHANLGVALRELGRHGEALESFSTALTLHRQPPLQLRRYWLETLSEVEGPGAAVAWLERQGPAAEDPELTSVWAESLARLGRFPEAREVYDRAVQLAPGSLAVRHGRGLIDLALGRFATGWEGYEDRWGLNARNGFTGPSQLMERLIVRPEPATLAGADVVLLGEQGIGDVIMFASIIPDLMAVAERVSLLTEPRLCRLFAGAFPDMQLSVLWPGAKVLGLGSLGYAFRREARTFPGAPYLRASAPARSRARARLGSPAPGCRRIGLSWRGGAATTGRGRRSVALAELIPVLRRPDVEFVSLQYGRHEEEIAAANRQLPRPIVVPPPEMIDDFDDLAGFVSELDGVLSVQTALIHLCGGLGAPCVVMVPRVPEWRYGAEGSAMLWYRSVTLVRERAEGGLAQVAAEALQTLIATIDGGPSRLTADG